MQGSIDIWQDQDVHMFIMCDVGQSPGPKIKTSSREESWLYEAGWKYLWYDNYYHVLDYTGLEYTETF
jgi:hypothetical protein